MINPWLGIFLVLVVLVALFGGLRALQRRYELHPELSRKIVHVAMGLVGLSFPWLFHEVWPVVLLSAISLAVMIALRKSQPLQLHLGGVLGGVDRDSWGEVYFPLAVGLLFWFTRGNPVLYCIPMLLLTLADAVSAWIGIQYGEHRYTTDDGKKSAEGSIAFFIVAFLSTHVPLLLFTETPRLQTLLIASMIGLLVMILEAIAWRGLDNLLIPLGSFALLKTYLAMDVVELTSRLAVAVALFVFMLVWRRRTTLKDSAMLGSALVGYACWALGGWRWLIAPITVLVSYTLLSPRTRRNVRRVHGIDAVICVASASMCWLFLSKTEGRPEFLYPYTLAFAAHLAMIGVARLRFDYPQMSTFAVLVRSIFIGWALLFAPFVAIHGASGNTIVVSLIALGGITLATIGFHLLQPGMDNCPTDTARWLRQAGLAAAGSVAALILVQA